MSRKIWVAGIMVCVIAPSVVGCRSPWERMVSKFGVEPLPYPEVVGAGGGLGDVFMVERKHSRTGSEAKYMQYTHGSLGPPEYSVREFRWGTRFALNVNVPCEEESPKELSTWLVEVGGVGGPKASARLEGVWVTDGSIVHGDITRELNRQDKLADLVDAEHTSFRYRSKVVLARRIVFSHCNSAVWNASVAGPEVTGVAKLEEQATGTWVLEAAEGQWLLCGHVLTEYKTKLGPGDAPLNQYGSVDVHAWLAWDK